MDTHLSELRSILTSELAVYDRLIDTARRMNEAIKSRDIDAVRSFTLNYDNGFVKIESLEERRLAVSDGIRQSLGLAGRHLTLQQLAAAVPEKERAELLALRSTLRKRVGELSGLNVSNRVLLEESLAAVAKNFELVMMTQNSAAVYGQGGTMAREPVRRNIVNRTA